MKKLIMLFAFFGLVGIVSINAQSCSKSAAATKSCTKTATAGKACCAKTSAAAAKLASMDDSIESKTCAKSGKVSYVRKSVCAVSGTTKLEDVKYCTDSKKFVNVSPASADKAVKAVKATKTSATTKKSCSKSCAKSCSKGKAASTNANAADGKAKLVKQEEQ